MAETRALLWGLALTHGNVGTILGSVNRMLHRDTGGESFVTLFFACLDPVRNSFTYASAGHPSGYVLDRAGEIVERLDSTGPALGVLDNADFGVRQAPTLAPGDILFLLTDGVEEACDSHGQAFGGHRPLDMIRQFRTEDPQALVKRLYESVRLFSENMPQEDDITSILIRRAEPSPLVRSLDGCRQAIATEVADCCVSTPRRESAEYVSCA
jgi:serine phosphatase RsbU (regulator of sigma subunit)